MKETIKRLRELEAAATPGPWEFITYSSDGWGSLLGARKDSKASVSLYTGKAHKTNAQFIAEMRNALPQLLDRLEKLEAIVRAYDARYFPSTDEELDYSALNGAILDARNALAALVEGEKE